MSSGNSACSTASFTRRKLLYNKIPEQPDGKDAGQWSKFLAAYQNGDWESTGSCQRVCPKTARKVQTSKGESLDNQGTLACTLSIPTKERANFHLFFFSHYSSVYEDFFLKYKYLAAPPAPKEKCKIRDETL